MIQKCFIQTDDCKEKYHWLRNTTILIVMEAHKDSWDTFISKEFLT